MARRRTDIDLLRIVGLLGVFLVHAGEPFNPWDEWHVTFARRSWGIGEMVVFFAPWVMPLFMFLAGGAAAIALAARSNRSYLRERVVRILVPFVVGVLVLVPPQVWIERRLEGRFRGGLLAFYPHFFQGLYPEGNFSWHHLWFLAYLFVFAVVTLPLFRAIQRGWGHHLLDRAAVISARPAGLLLWALPLFVFRVPPFPIPKLRLPPYDFPNHALLLPMYVAGFLFAHHAGLQRALRRGWKWAIPAAVGLTVGMLALTWNGEPYEELPAHRNAGYWLLGVFYVLGAWGWVVMLSGLALRVAPRQSELLFRSRALLYPFYVLHQPLIVAFAAAGVVERLGTVPAFLLVLSGGFVSTMLLCLLALRWRPVQLVLGGQPRSSEERKPPTRAS